MVGSSAVRHASWGTCCTTGISENALYDEQLGKKTPLFFLQLQSKIPGRRSSHLRSKKKRWTKDVLVYVARNGSPSMESVMPNTAPAWRGCSLILTLEPPDGPSHEQTQGSASKTRKKEKA